MKIYFKNGSKIETLDATDSTRGYRSTLIYYFNDKLTWWQKIYLKILRWYKKINFIILERK